MPTLWTFGDSFTFGHGCRPDGPINEYYYNYKSYSDDVWPNLLGQMLNVEVKNLGKCGASNDFIIDSIIDNWDFIQKDDFVIIGITFYTRIDTPYGDTLESPYFDKNTTENDTPYNKEEFETLVNLGVEVSYKLNYDKEFSHFVEGSYFNGVIAVDEYEELFRVNDLNRVIVSAKRINDYFHKQFYTETLLFHHQLRIHFANHKSIFSRF